MTALIALLIALLAALYFYFIPVTLVGDSEEGAGPPPTVGPAPTISLISDADLSTPYVK